MTLRPRRRRALTLSAVERLEGRRLLASYTVNTFLDAPAVDPSNGDAATAAGTISLRSAIQAADALAVPVTINLPAGTYALSIAPNGIDDASNGDLNVTGDLTIVGAGAGSTTIDAASIDRVLTVQGGSAAINGVTISGGRDAGASPRMRAGAASGSIPAACR